MQMVKQRIVHLLHLTNLLTHGGDHILAHVPSKPTCHRVCSYWPRTERKSKNQPSDNPNSKAEI